MGKRLRLPCALMNMLWISLMLFWRVMFDHDSVSFYLRISRVIRDEKLNLFDGSEKRWKQNQSNRIFVIRSMPDWTATFDFINHLNIVETQKNAERKNRLCRQKYLCWLLINRLIFADVRCRNKKKPQVNQQLATACIELLTEPLVKCSWKAYFHLQQMSRLCPLILTPHNNGQWFFKDNTRDERNLNLC